MKKGQDVMVRSYAAGVFAGTLVSEKDTPTGKTVVLDNSRRIWRWEGSATLSQLAVEGTKKPQNCKFPCAIPKGHQIERVEEMIPITQEARKSIDSVQVWSA